MTTPFFVAVTGINQEALAKRRLTEKGFEVYFPIGKKIVRHARREETRIFPVFSRYVFVKCTQAWGAIREADGVIDILTNNLEPLEVKNEIIEEIKQREAHGAFDIIPVRPHKKKRWSKSFDILKNLLNPEALIQV